MKNPFKKLVKYLFGRSDESWHAKESHTYLRNREDGILRFNSISVQGKTPPNSSIGENDFVEVIYKNKPMWVLFKCPCGCETTISLSLQNVHKPYWRLLTKNNRPTLYPSVWQKSGCCSHFWVYEGCIHWE